MRNLHFAIGRRFLRPSAERWTEPGPGVYWYVQAFGLHVYYDSTLPVTVGERGVW